MKKETTKYLIWGVLMTILFSLVLSLLTGCAGTRDGDWFYNNGLEKRPVKCTEIKPGQINCQSYDK